MIDKASSPQAALKYEVEVREHGRLEFNVPFEAGVHVTVFVIPESEESFGDLVAASESSLDFWDNPWDDEDWNNA